LDSHRNHTVVTHCDLSSLGAQVRGCGSISVRLRQAAGANSPTGSLAAGGRVARLSPQLHYDEFEQLCVPCCFFRVFFSCHVSFTLLLCTCLYLQDCSRTAPSLAVRQAIHCTTSGQLKIATRDFSKTAGRTPIFEARIVIYDQIWVHNSVFKTFSTETLSTAARSYFLPLSRAAGRDGAARRDHPSQGHGSSPAALHQMPRCTADECTSIVPGQFSFGPDFDAELPAVPAPQSVVLHPHQLHISTSRELLAYP
jgi:hypothetical protein